MKLNEIENPSMFRDSMQATDFMQEFEEHMGHIEDRITDPRVKPYLTVTDKNFSTNTVKHYEEFVKHWQSAKKEFLIMQNIIDKTAD